MASKPKLTYIGSFPPPYGGVTVKNALLYRHLSSRLDIGRVDLSRVKKFEPRLLEGLVRALVSRDGAIVLGVSADWRYRLTSFLYHFNRKKMNRSFLFVMGGKVPDDRAYVKRMNGYKHVYVETESMRKAFEAMGAWNVSVYPNCRERPTVPVRVKPSEGSLRSVFFSLISPGKGVELILEAAGMMPEVEFHLYGRIEEGYGPRFEEGLRMRQNVRYHGVFDSVEGDVQAELNKYDVHLFPTLCPNEGVPGVIAETKMAAVPTIASDRSYNSELIEDGVDGLLTHEDSVEELVDIIRDLSSDSARLDRMKAAAFRSAEGYYIDRYIDSIVGDLTGLE